jgi:hypothetical protein
MLTNPIDDHWVTTNKPSAAALTMRTKIFHRVMQNDAIAYRSASFYLLFACFCQNIFSTVKM